MHWTHPENFPSLITIFLSDGQATENIRQGQGINHLIPIIAVTANAMKGDREKVKPSNNNPYCCSNF